MPLDQKHRAGNLAGRNLVAQVVADFGEPFPREAVGSGWRFRASDVAGERSQQKRQRRHELKAQDAADASKLHDLARRPEKTGKV